jgi:adenylate cyclase
MALEIERKFLVASDDWRAYAVDAKRMRQGYLAGSERLSIRVRVAGDDAWLNIKHAQSTLVRHEFEYPVPLADALELMSLACELGTVDKTRHRVPHGTHVWEVDEFHGDNRGLVVAELELASEDEPFEHPAWLGPEVSGDPRYLNQHLAREPFTRWAGREPG